MKWNSIYVTMIFFVAVVFGMTGCGGSGGNAPNNKVTAAEAGPAQNVVAGSFVTLNGSQSTGADGSLISYRWSMVTKPVGSAATINNPTTVNPTFTTDLAGQYSIKLIVTDTKLITSEDTVMVIATASVANAAPVANAGIAQNVVTGALVTLDGSGSSDANNDLLTYSWAFTSKPIGSGASLSSLTNVNPTIIADVAGAYVFSLVVNDGKVNSAATTVTVTASDANAAPVANAGTAQNVVTGALVTLDGSGSSDANNDLLTYSWAFTSKPTGSGVSLSNSTNVKPTFTADVAGAYVLQLTVSDGTVTSTASTVTINAVTACESKIPSEQPASVRREVTIYSSPPVLGDPSVQYGGVMGWVNATVGTGGTTGTVTVSNLQLWENQNGIKKVLTDKIICPLCDPVDRVAGYSLDKTFWQDKSVWANKVNEGTKFLTSGQSVIVPVATLPNDVYHFWHIDWPRPLAKANATYYITADVLVEGDAMVQIGIDFYQTIWAPTNVEAAVSNWACSSADVQTIKAGAYR
ncbi:MAG: PKD domain-containing protein [Desulfuromonadaceae bacterium]